MATLVAKEIMVGSGGVCSRWESKVRLSVVCRCVWQESGFSRRDDELTFNLLFKQYYKFCTYSVICKVDAAINCITVQHKKINFH
jgi:hypothetical protein